MSTFLVLGATGGTGRQFVSLALERGHTVRAIVRNPSKLSSAITHPNLHIFQGSITDDHLANLDDYVRGSDYVISMLGDAAAQAQAKINTAFVRDQLVPAMRRTGVKRFLYQAGGFSKPYKEYYSPVIWILRHTIVRQFAGLSFMPKNDIAMLTTSGQHADNEAVMEYLATEAMDIEWMVHRAGINPNRDDSKGVLRRSPNSESKVSVGTFKDCAAYNLQVVQDDSAVHTQCLSCYV